jgi:aminoglycoside phosphotransferase (APT) family kinase protein
MNPRRPADADALRTDLGAGLDAAVRRAAGPRAEVVAVQRSPSPYAAVSPSEVAAVELASGERVSIFVKHLGDEQRDHPDKGVREREARVYDELLADRDVAAPRFLGAAANEATGRLDLFLEYVDGWNLKYQGLDRWRGAARRLARLHLAFAAPDGRPLGRDFLLRLDRDYVAAWAERAVAAVSSLSARLGGRLRRTVDRMGAAADLLAGQPPTLVHNDLAPKNVIAATAAGGERICIVDWEMAGVGCGLVDLAHLTHGLAPEEAARMLEAYGRELAGSNLLPPAGERERLLAACRLHGALYRLAHVDAWGLPPETAATWIAESERLNREVAR